MSTPTVPAFVVLADSNGKSQDLGLFYRATDATKYLEGLSKQDWANARIEARQLPIADVHPAHQNLFPDHFPQSK